MVKEYTFFDYIDAEKSGTNVILAWLNSDGKPAKARFTFIIKYLGTSSPPGSNGSYWCEPMTKAMKGNWIGFIELRAKINKIQYRLIGKMVNRNFFLVATAFHKGSYVTNITPKTGDDRVKQMINNPLKYRSEHDNR
jgi:hypothetical protein